MRILILRRKVAPDRAANALDSQIRTFLGRHDFGLILMRTLPTVGKLKLAGKNMSRLGTQIDKRLAAELSVTEKQGVWKPAITKSMALQTLAGFVTKESDPCSARAVRRRPAMLYALALLLMIVAVIFLCLSVIFGDIEWVLTGIGALLFFGLLLLVSETRSGL